MFEKLKDREPSPVFVAAVFSSGLTKIGRGTVSRMSAKVFGKGIIAGIASDLGVSTSFGVIDALEEKFNKIFDENSAYGSIYWCAA